MRTLAGSIIGTHLPWRSRSLGSSVVRILFRLASCVLATVSSVIDRGLAKDSDLLCFWTESPSTRRLPSTLTRSPMSLVCCPALSMAHKAENSEVVSNAPSDWRRPARMLMTVRGMLVIGTRVSSLCDLRQTVLVRGRLSKHSMQAASGPESGSQVWHSSSTAPPHKGSERYQQLINDLLHCAASADLVELHRPAQTAASLTIRNLGERLIPAGGRCPIRSKCSSERLKDKDTKPGRWSASYITQINGMYVPGSRVENYSRYQLNRPVTAYLSCSTPLVGELPPSFAVRCQRLSQ